MGTSPEVDAITSALITTMGMLGMKELADTTKRKLDSLTNGEVHIWAEALWKLQKPRFRQMWADDIEHTGGRALLNLLTLDENSTLMLCDALELYGVYSVTAPLLRDIMKYVLHEDGTDVADLSRLKTHRGSVRICLSQQDYMRVYCEPCQDQVDFTNEFLQWQIRFGNIKSLLDEGNCRA